MTITAGEEARIQAKLVDIEAALAPCLVLSSEPGGFTPLNLPRPSATSAICASLRRDENTQYLFLTFFQVLVAVLALGTLLLLVAALWQVSRGDAIAVVLDGAGAIVTGVAASWLLARQRDARTTYRAIQRALDKHNC